MTDGTVRSAADGIAGTCGHGLYVDRGKQGQWPKCDEMVMGCHKLVHALMITLFGISASGMF